jgi:hypothetical protein
MWWRQIGEAWAGLKALLSVREPGETRRIHLVKAKIRRHIETTQARTAGGALFSYDGLVQSRVVEGDELTYTLDALDELVADGVLEHVPDQLYALRGRGPFGRVNPP